MLRHPRALSLLVSALLATVAVMQLRLGQDSVPAPLVQASISLFAWSPEAAARTVVALELALAAAVLVAGTRWLSCASLVLVAFVALACVSAGIRTNGWALDAVVLAISIGGLWLASRGHDAAAPRRRGLSPAWTAILALAAGTVTARVSSAVDFSRPAESDVQAKARINSIDLDLKPYVGRSVADSPIATYLPRIAAELGDATTYIVFYNPRCDACHSLFEAHFAEPRLERVIAVEIPPAADAVLVDGDHHGPIECPSCEFETLPPGPLWLIAPPMTVKVERGVIVCVADRFGGDCVNPQ